MFFLEGNKLIVPTSRIWPFTSWHHSLGRIHEGVILCFFELNRPSDQWIFPGNPEASLPRETATANRLGNWIGSRWKVVDHSKKVARKESSRGMANMAIYFQPVDPEDIARVRTWRQDRFVHDAYCKKRRRKQPTNTRSAQHSIVGYLLQHRNLDQ